MPMRDGGYERIELADPSERLGRRCQEAWYLYVASMPCGTSVLDVGAGDGYGMDILRGAYDHVEGIDPAPLREDVLKSSLEDFSGCGCGCVGGCDLFDAVVAMDVVEHVQRPDEFIQMMQRLARRAVFFSTPNWEHSKCANKYHAFEFTRAELEAVLRWSNYEIIEVGTNFGVWIRSR